MQKSIDENESDWYNYIVSLCYPKRSRKVVLLLKTQKALLIVNPCAGRNNKRLAPLEIVKKFSQPEWDTDIRTTRCQGDATTIVREIGAQYDVRQVPPTPLPRPSVFRPSSELPPTSSEAARKIPTTSARLTASILHTLPRSVLRRIFPTALRKS